MLPKANKEVTIDTPRHTLKVDCYYNYVSVDKIKTDKNLFSEMCKLGCKNFNKKYCCPPHSPNFSSCIKDYKYLLVLLLKINLNQLSKYGYKDYHKLRIGNAVIKPRIEKVMRLLENNFNSRFLSTGACRLCKPCQRKLGKPCKHPDKMRFSLESVGVDCNQLTEKVFNFPLLWYKDKKAPEYTAVICALPLKDNANKKEIFQLIENNLLFTFGIAPPVPDGKELSPWKPLLGKTVLSQPLPG